MTFSAKIAAMILSADGSVKYEGFIELPITGVQPVNCNKQIGEALNAKPVAEASKCTFSKGTTVRLRSGGPIMTVSNEPKVSPAGTSVSCVWFNGLDTRERSFDVETLVLASVQPLPKPKPPKVIK